MAGEKLLSKGGDNKLEIVAFCCHNSIPDTAAGERRSNLKVVKIPCSGKVEIIHLLKVFEAGIDGVCVVGCPPKQCRFLEGSLRAKRRVKEAKRLLDEIGIGGQRLVMYQSSSDGSGFSKDIENLFKKIEELGPNPLRSEDA